MQYWYVIYDSDGNPIGATGRPANIGTLIAEHYALVDDSNRLNGELGIPPVDEALTVKREPIATGVNVAEYIRSKR